MNPTTKLCLLLGLFQLTFAAAEKPAQATDRFVVVTDSHGVGHFGEELALWLRKRAQTKFEFFASGASAPLQWTNGAFTTPCGFEDKSKIATPLPRQCNKLHTPSLKYLWQQEPAPTEDERRISIIALGTNFSMSPAWRAGHVLETQKLVEDAMAHSERCLWVGPPSMTRKPGFDPPAVAYKIKIIEEAIELAAKKTGKPACQFIDSRPLSHYPKHGDGIHLHWAGQKDPGALKASGEWADGVAAQADCLLALPATTRAKPEANSCQ